MAFSRSDSMSSSRELYSTNAWKTRRAPERSIHAREGVLDQPKSFYMGRWNEKPVITDADYPYVSQASNFARGGIELGQGLKGKYVRDPTGGAWFKDKRDKPWSVPLQPVRSCPLLKLEH